MLVTGADSGIYEWGRATTGGGLKEGGDPLLVGIFAKMKLNCAPILRGKSKIDSYCNHNRIAVFTLI